MKTFFRKLHRWLGLLMALQIIAWMGSGLYFSIFPIETIRGEHLTREAALPDPGELEGLVTPAVAWKEVSRQFDGQATLTNITLSRFDGRTWYRVSGTTEGEPFSRLVGGGNGDVMARLEREAAITAALDVLAVSA
ncbi:MAG: hypothetical protein GWM87_09755, partial [Xanthomonadales bacterium]|nr:hypothetical protein [Xanthomonadales bacterium]NIX13183.1 hypothetical protein [Xanthomonadales bacterium]